MAREFIITGGGTGGHVFPMQAVAEQLRASGVEASDITFVGSRRGKEVDLLGASDSELIRLPGRGLSRSLTARSLWANLGAIGALGVAVLAALGIMMRRRPRVVVSVGGYAALACDVAAVVTRRRLVLVDLDAHPSAVHRILSRFAARRCVAFPDRDPRAVFTGAPLRHEIEAVDRSAVSWSTAGSPGPDRWNIVVMTGSLGARSVNDAVLELSRLWRGRADVILTHVTGQRDFEHCRELNSLEPSDALDYRQIAFGDMATLWSRCDVAVCRAGGVTIAELAYLAIPSVLVPLPGAPGDHQTHNARGLVDAGGAVMIADAQLTGALLASTLESLWDPQRLRDMARGAHTLGRPHAAAAIASVVLDEAR